MDRDEDYADASGVNDESIDIDLVLLGADFPDDVDDGPVDEDPEQSHTSFGDFYLPAKRCSSDTAKEASLALAPSLLQNSVTLRSTSSAHSLSKVNLRGHSFGGTYVVASIQEWRESISVFLI